MLALFVLGCGGTPCDEFTDTTDYTDESNWICLPGRDDLCSEEVDANQVRPDASVGELDVSVADNPSYDCFYVYPTTDLRRAARVHEDLSDLEDEVVAVQAQALWLRQHCRLYVPAYRQATYGNYFKRDAVAEPCFEVAYADVEAAWEEYLANHNEGRPVVLYGHSQGGQMVSRLYRERDDDVVAAYPIGWPVSAENQCVDGDETGCVVSYKSYLDTDTPPSNRGYAEGEEVACVDPSGDGILSAVFYVDAADYLPEGLDLPVPSYVVYGDAFTGECVGEGTDVGLEIGWRGEDDRSNPVDWDMRALTGGNGAHVLDVQWALVDLGLDMDQRAAAWNAQ
jgi:pimeloyl-ACP methyl ester carboxylesterase